MTTDASPASLEIVLWMKLVEMVIIIAEVAALAHVLGHRIGITDQGMTDETGTTERVARAAICEDPGMKTVDEVAAQKGKSQVVKGLLH